MLGRIHTEMDEFTGNVKTIKGYNDLMEYMHSGVYSSIKLLLFASQTFSIYGRVMLFFMISLVGLLVLSAIGVALLNTLYLLLGSIILFVLILAYVMHCKNFLIVSIENAKKSMEKSE